MKLLIATGYSEITDAIKDQLSNATGNIGSFELTFVETVDDLVEELKNNTHDFIITEYSIDGADIWRLAKLVNSTQLAAHTLPLYLIQDTCETEIPPTLARAHHFTVVVLAELVPSLLAAYEHNRTTGYIRGLRQPAKPSLLIIEDDENAANLIQFNLNNNFDIDIAYTGEAGLELWRNKRHELVLLDYMLPGIKGDEVLAKMMVVDKNQPVIMMTAYDYPDRNKNMILNGASEYLCKPFDIADLKEQCNTILDRAKLIYQACYSDAKNQTLKHLVCELDHFLTHNEIEKAKRAAKAIKLIFPDALTEDEQAELLS